MPINEGTFDGQLGRTPVSDAESVDAAVDDVAVQLGRTVEHVPWDSPAVLSEVALDQVPYRSGTALQWSTGNTQELDGHPFHDLVGRTVSGDAVGAALVIEAWLTPVPGTTRPLDHEVAAHLGDDGRAEARSVMVMLRDGTTGFATHVRGGTGWHTASEMDTAGRVPAALARTLGRPSGLTCEAAGPLARRLWAWGALCAVAGITAGIRAEGAGTEAGALATAASEGFATLGDGIVDVVEHGPVLDMVVPAAVRWLVRRGDRGWTTLLSEARRSFPRGAVAELLALPEDRFDAGRWERGSWGPGGRQARALEWCDEGILALWFTQAAPEEDRVRSLWRQLVQQGDLTLTWHDLWGRALRAVGH